MVKKARDLEPKGKEKKDSKKESNLASGRYALGAARQPRPPASREACARRATSRCIDNWLQHLDTGDSKRRSHVSRTSRLPLPWRRLARLLRPIRSGLAAMIAMSTGGVLVGLVPPLALGLWSMRWWTAKTRPRRRARGSDRARRSPPKPRPMSCPTGSRPQRQSPLPQPAPADVRRRPQTSLNRRGRTERHAITVHLRR